jgi:hypothetical protein
MSRQSDYITIARQNAKQLWDALNTLEALQKEWNALDYGTTLPAGAGDNSGLDAAEIGAVVFDTANAIRATLNAGHATNLAKLL